MRAYIGNDGQQTSPRCFRRDDSRFSSAAPRAPRYDSRSTREDV